MTTLVLVFKQIESKDKTKLNNFYSSSKAEIIINDSDIVDVFQSIFTAIISNMKKSLGKGLGWIIIQSLIKPLVFQSFSWKQLYEIIERIRPSKKRID